MQCPVDGSTLTMSERSGIEIDYCPQCRGVWLDRGELDKIIDRSLGQQPAVSPPAPVQQVPVQQAHESSYERERDERRQQQERRYADPYQQPYQQAYRKKRKDSWLSEIFD